MSDNTGTGQKLEAERPCSICLGRERQVLSLIGRGFEKLTTVICTGCGLVHHRKIPTDAELTRFYAVDYRKKYKATFKPKLKHIYRYAPGAYQRAAQLAALAGPGQRRFLDIGSGSGEILYMARRMGFEVTGIEPNIGYAEYTRSELGLPVRNCDYRQADLPSGHFDILNLNHVLEHLPDPLASLRFLNRVLRPGGILCVAVPDIENTTHAPWTRFHYAHIHNFNHQTLKAVVEKAGFEPLEDCTTGTTLLARKTGETFCDMPRPMTENYRMLWRQLAGSQSVVTHVASRKGFGRFVRKLYRYPKEYLLAKVHGSPRAILDKVHARMSESHGTLLLGLIAAV